MWLKFPKSMTKKLKQASTAEDIARNALSFELVCKCSDSNYHKFYVGMINKRLNCI